jgi:YD repeat-containing protein
MRTSQGSHVGYNEVRVTQGNGGYTIYKFHPYTRSEIVAIRSINASQCSLDAPNYPPAPEPFDFRRGELINKSVYNAAGVRLQQEIYNTDYKYDTIGVTGLTFRTYHAGGGNTKYLATEYELKSARKKKVIQEGFRYDVLTGQAPVYLKTETYFDSPNHTLPTKLITTDAPTSGRVLSEERRTYTGDVIIPVCGGNYSTTDDNSLVTKIASANETYAYQKSLCGSNTTCLFNAWKDYYIIKRNEDRKGWVNNRVRHINDYKTCMKSTATWNAASTDLKALIKLKHHNQVTQIIESSQWRESKLLASTFLTMKDFENDTISIYPSKLDVITTVTPLAAANFAPVSFTNSAVVRDSKYVLEETYSHKNGNLVEVVLKNGITTSYLWDTQIKLPIAKAEGVPYSTLSSAYAASGNNLLTLRNQASLSAALVTTYVHDPLIGITSKTDSNNKTMYYQYDALGRLILLKNNDQHAVKNYLYHYKKP